MFAILAAVCFALRLFSVEIGSVDLVVLGLLFIAIYLVWSPVMPFAVTRRN